MQEVLDKTVRSNVAERIDQSKDSILETLAKAVRIQSINPRYPGVDVDKVLGGERSVSEFFKPILESFGCKTDLFENAPKRTNLVGVLKGTGGGKSLILNGHIDTVPFGDVKQWKQDPLGAKMADGKMYGRGSTDMKSGDTAMIKAVEAIVKSGYRLKGDVIITLVVGEETMDHELGTTGCIKRGYKADAAIVTEPSAPPNRLGIVPVTPGLWWMKIKVPGKITHVGNRSEFVRAGGGGQKVGVNAVEKGVKVIQALLELEQQWGISKQHPLFKTGFFTIHPGVVMAGPTGVNIPFIVSDYCDIDYAIWYHPKETPEQVRKEVENYVHQFCQLDDWLKEHPPTFEWKLSWPPNNVPLDHPITKTMVAAHELATGQPAKFQGFHAASDVTFLGWAGIPAIIYGPGDVMVAHSIDEYVYTSEVIDASKGLAYAVMNWCGYEKK